MDVCWCLLYGCNSSTESAGKSAGTWIPYQSVLWSPLDMLLGTLLEMLLGSLLHSRLGSFLQICMTEQCVNAVSERCILWEELSFPHDAFGRWKYMSLGKVWYKCWQTESACLCASGTIITITNTINIIIITIAIMPLPPLLSALDWMCTHTLTICRLWVADFAWKSKSQD